MPRVVVYTGRLDRSTSRLLGIQEKRRLDLLLIAEPKSGEVIKKAGGARKLRFPIKLKGLGKRSGGRVVHYYWDGGDVVYILDVYEKSKQSDVSEEDKEAIKNFIDSLGD